MLVTVKATVTLELDADDIKDASARIATCLKGEDVLVVWSVGQYTNAKITIDPSTIEANDEDED